MAYVINNLKKSNSIWSGEIGVQECLGHATHSHSLVVFNKMEQRIEIQLTADEAQRIAETLIDLKK